jgi:hypothetical protein
MLVSIAVPIEEELVPEFLIRTGTWLAEQRGVSVALAKRTPWTPDDHGVAVVWLQKLTRSARDLMDWLIRHPGVKVRGSQLAEACGLESNYKVAGTLSWPGRYAYAAGKTLPFEWDGEFISMSHEVAEILAMALEEVETEETGLTAEERFSVPGPGAEQ